VSGAYRSLYVLVALLPFAGSIFLLSRSTAWQPLLKPWRKRLWLVGMSVVTAFSLTLLFALSLNLFREPAANFAISVYGFWLISGAFLVPAAAISIGFGVGRLRWLGLLSAIITAACIEFAMVAAATGMAGI
jgi:hypothetical protein